MIVLFSLTLGWTDNTFFSYAPIISDHECMDVSELVDTSHSHNAADHVFTSGWLHNSAVPTGRIQIVPALHVPIKGNYVSGIWQPPRFC